MSKKQALQLYRQLMREANKFPSYNFRNYALRRIRDSFRENQHLDDEAIVKVKFAEAAKNLEIIKNQVVIGQLYSTDKLVIEHLHT